MIRALFDVDVLLDVIEERSPHVEASSRALALVEAGNAEGLVAAHSLPIVFYLVHKHRGGEAAYEALQLLLQLLEVVPVDRDRLTEAVAMGWSDFEDALQGACALRAGAEVLVTRNPGDYAGLSLAVEIPSEFLARLGFLPLPGAADEEPGGDGPPD